MSSVEKERYKTKKTLILTRKDMVGLLSISEYNEGVEQAYRIHGQGNYLMEPKGHIYVDHKYSKGDEYEVMPSYTEEPESSVCKWVAIREENPKRGLPMVLPIIFYTEPDTGFPLAVLDGIHHTYMRTGASAGVGAKWLARKDSEVLALVGAGGVNERSLESIDDLFPIREARVWTRSKERRENFLARASARQLKNEIRIVGCDTVEEAVAGADIIVSATASTTPLIMNDWVKDGAHISAIGADKPGDQELDVKIMQRGRIFVDDMDQCITDGEINVPLRNGDITKNDIAGTIGEVITGKRTGRTSDGDVTIFDSTGISLQEAATVPLEFRRALEKGLGIEVNIVL